MLKPPESETLEYASVVHSHATMPDRALRALVGWMAILISVIGLGASVAKLAPSNAWAMLLSSSASTTMDLASKMLWIVDLMAEASLLVGGCVLLRYRSLSGVRFIRAGAIGMIVVVLGSTAMVLSNPAYRSGYATKSKVAYLVFYNLRLASPYVMFRWLTLRTFARRITMADE